MKLSPALILLLFIPPGLLAGTAVRMDVDLFRLLHDTEELRYYKGMRSYDLDSWTLGRMPIFLGVGGEMEVPLLVPTSLIDLGNIFFRVEEGDLLQPYNTDNHPPIPVLQYTPNYPTELRRDGIEGDVTVLFTIGVDGSVSNLEIEHSTDSRFNQEVLYTVSFWRFIPARIEGNTVAIRARQVIPFRIQ